MASSDEWTAERHDEAATAEWCMWQTLDRDNITMEDNRIWMTSEERLVDALKHSRPLRGDVAWVHLSLKADIGRISECAGRTYVAPLGVTEEEGTILTEFVRFRVHYLRLILRNVIAYDLGRDSLEQPALATAMLMACRDTTDKDHAKAVISLLVATCAPRALMASLSMVMFEDVNDANRSGVPSTVGKVKKNPMVKAARAYRG